MHVSQQVQCAADDTPVSGRHLCLENSGAKHSWMDAVGMKMITFLRYVSLMMYTKFFTIFPTVTPSIVMFNWHTNFHFQIVCLKLGVTV